MTPGIFRQIFDFTGSVPDQPPPPSSASGLDAPAQ
jgi:hypothetical protein